MTEQEKKIYDIIKGAEGISATGIAIALGDKKEIINSVLFQSKALATVVKQNPDLKWYVINTATKSAAPTKESQLPDEDLKKLCDYYLQCITIESSNSVSLFLSNKDQYKVLNGLTLNDPRDKPAITFLNKISQDRTKKAYLGYPTRIYSVHGKDGKWHKMLAPVFLFPVEYNEGALDISWVPSINMEVLVRYCGKSRETLVNALVDLQTELGMNDPNLAIEVDDLVLRLVNIRQWEWAEQIDPYHIPEAANLANLNDGIYNRPVIVEAEKPSFTVGLEAELMALALLPEQKYKGTALYSWIKDVSIAEQTSGTSKQLLEVLPLNTEQTQAVETALDSELTIVTGPPGTGKSQVVTDLLTNIAWNEKSALFSSRNNKAVDVVEKRVNGLSKRPSLLRLGSDQHDEVLADIIEALLNSPAAPDEHIELEVMLQTYDDYCSKEEELKAQKLVLVQNRNLLDEKEREYCTVRDVIGDHLFTISENDTGKILDSAMAYIRAVSRTKKENNGFFARLFWGSVEPKRIAELEAAEKAYDKYAIRYDLVRPEEDRSEDKLQRIQQSVEEFEKAIPLAFEYRSALKKMHSDVTMEQIDQELAALKIKCADLAQEIWDKWLRTNKLVFTKEERQEMNGFITTVKLGDPVESETVNKMIRLARRYIPCWAVTSLSAKRRIPFEPGIFDYVIIDEASQCDIASMIPLLYRAKRAVIIGDPQQLPHISELAPKQDSALLKKYEVDNMWSYSVNSLYRLASAKVEPDRIVQLRDHFRSCADIIEFSNDTFYNGTLRTATRYDRLRPPPGEKPGIRWIQTKGITIRPNSGSAYNEKEIEKVVSELKRLVEVGYAGTIGVTTPFRLQADKIKKALEKEPKLLSDLVENNSFLADTVHSFQGDERDLMIFSCVVTETAAPGTISYLNRTGNLFNVAITRARSTLVVIGNYHYCVDCSIPYLRRFAKYVADLAKGKQTQTDVPEIGKTPAFPIQPVPKDVSRWEELLYTALFNVGIKTAVQYPVDRYRLDLAHFLPNGRKLDIEVDGEMYHRSWSGELCYRDQLRNQRLFELGWDVKRFWVYQIRDDLPWCIQQVQEWCQTANQ